MLPFVLGWVSVFQPRVHSCHVGRLWTSDNALGGSLFWFTQPSLHMPWHCGYPENPISADMKKSVQEALKLRCDPAVRTALQQRRIVALVPRIRTFLKLADADVSQHAAKFATLDPSDGTVQSALGIEEDEIVIELLGAAVSEVATQVNEAAAKAKAGETRSPKGTFCFFGCLRGNECLWEVVLRDAVSLT